MKCQVWYQVLNPTFDFFSVFLPFKKRCLTLEITLVSLVRLHTFHIKKYLNVLMINKLKTHELIWHISAELSYPRPKFMSHSLTLGHWRFYLPGFELSCRLREDFYVQKYVRSVHKRASAIFNSAWSWDVDLRKTSLDSGKIHAIDNAYNVTIA